MAKREKHPDRVAMEDYASQRLREVRSRLEMTQDEMAELLSFKTENSISQKTIYRWEAGIHPVPAWALLHVEMVDKEIDVNPQEKAIKTVQPFVSKVIKKVRDYLDK